MFDLIFFLIRVGIKFDVVPSGVVAFAQNWTQHRTVVYRILFSHNIRNVFANNAAGQEIRLRALVHHTL